MRTVHSADGTPIAVEWSGEGPPVVLVAGALCDRGSTRPLAEALAGRFRVAGYDRRGRGDSGDTPPYAVEREVEDLAAVLADAGGTASVYGHSSGAGLVLHAAARGLPIDRLVLHEPPYGLGGEEELRDAREYARRLRAVLAEDRNGDAVELFMTTVGMPPELVRQQRAEPWWPRLEALAPSLAYDSAVMGDVDGGAIPAGLLGAAAMPATVLGGGASPEWMLEAGRRMAAAMPRGRFQVLEGQDHNVDPSVLAPVLTELLAPGGPPGAPAPRPRRRSAWRSSGPRR